MSDNPMAYHITFGTYGMRLHGDERGTVDRRHNEPGEPIVGRNDQWQSLERGLLKYEPVILTGPQRVMAQTILPELCERGGWIHHIAAVMQDHVHVLVTTRAEGKAVRRWIKAWLGQELSKQWSLPAGAGWWAEGGSVKWVWDQSYYETVWGYIHQQRLLTV